jgi:branched-chain amino acid transport system substrate-binding protein
MLKRITVSIAWIGLLVLGVSACGGPSSSTGNTPIKVGVMLDLTGSSGAQAGAGGKQGTELAYAEINSHGGINGRPIQTVEEDSASTPDGGILAARKLVQQDSALVIQSVSSSAALIPALPFLESAGIPVIASASGSPSLLNPLRKNVFGGAGVPQTTQVPAELDAVQKLMPNLKKVALVTSTSEAFVVSEKKLLLTEYAKRGIQVVAQATFAGTDTDFTAQVQAVKKSSPDAVNIVGLPPATSRILIQLHRAGVMVPMFGDPAAADDALINLAGPDAEGFYAAYTSGVQYPSDNTGLMATFRTRFNAQFPTANAAAYPNFITIQAYADAYVLADALKRAGTNLTSAAILAALEQTSSFVAGQTSGAGSSWSWAVPVGMPRSFSATDHQGSRNLVMLKVVNGHFVPAT